MRGVVIPLLGGAVMLAGPLVLLPYRKFNDVLDGATFGATAAVTFVAAQSFAQAVDLFAGGHPPGRRPAPVGRAPRRARHRQPGHRRGGDRIGGGRALAPPPGADSGPPSPRAARPPGRRDRRCGAAARRGGVGQLVLPFVAALAWLALLAAVAMIWLRAVIHLGLLQEAAEIEIGTRSAARTAPG